MTLAYGWYSASIMKTQLIEIIGIFGGGGGNRKIVPEKGVINDIE